MKSDRVGSCRGGDRLRSGKVGSGQMWSDGVGLSQMEIREELISVSRVRSDQAAVARTKTLSFIVRTKLITQYDMFRCVTYNCRAIVCHDDM